MGPSHHINSYEVVALGVGIISTVMVKFGAWLERQVQDAELRECKRVWVEEIRPEIDWIEQSWINPWSRRTLEETEVEYDSFVDVSECIARMNADTEDYIAKLRVREY